IESQFHESRIRDCASDFNLGDQNESRQSGTSIRLKSAKRGGRMTRIQGSLAAVRDAPTLRGSVARIGPRGCSRAIAVFRANTRNPSTQTTSRLVSFAVLAI